MGVGEAAVASVSCGPWPINRAFDQRSFLLQACRETQGSRSRVASSRADTQLLCYCSQALLERLSASAHSIHSLTLEAPSVRSRKSLPDRAARGSQRPV